jgi:anti-anti-sigma factor
MKNDQVASTRIVLEGELNIYTAGAQRQCLLDAMGKDGDMEVDLSRVSEIDSAGLQLMLAAKREAAAHDRQLLFTGFSQAVLEIIELCDLADPLGQPAPSRSAA